MNGNDQFLRTLIVAENAREGGRLDAAVVAGLFAAWLVVVGEIARDTLDQTRETTMREGQELLLESFQRLIQVIEPGK
jgi:hypothetical protein